MLGFNNIDEKFRTKFEIVENGSGVFTGVIDEISQTQVPSYVFSPPRRLLRVDRRLPLNTTMVLRTNGGTVFLIGHHGDSETNQGTVFRIYRLFEPTKTYHWQRRTQYVDPVTLLQADDGMHDMSPAYIWGSYEPTPEQFDRETHVSIETARFITNQPIQRQDHLDGKSVVRVDYQLGLYIATLE
jgi:hypothetical protein